MYLFNFDSQEDARKKSTAHIDKLTNEYFYSHVKDYILNNAIL